MEKIAQPSQKKYVGISSFKELELLTDSLMTARTVSPVYIREICVRNAIKEATADAALVALIVQACVLTMKKRRASVFSNRRMSAMDARNGASALWRNICMTLFEHRRNT